MQVGDSEYLRAYAKGTIERTLVASNGTLYTIEINDVLYVPSMACNLISGEMLRKEGLFYRNDTQSLFTEEEKVGTVKAIGGLPHLVQHYNRVHLAAMADDIEPPIALSSHTITPSKATADLWHLRAGHAAGTTLALAKKACTGIIITENSELAGSGTLCNGCEEGNAHKQHSRVLAERPKEVYSEMSVDTVVISTNGIGNVSYFTMMTDSTSLYRHVYDHSTRGGAGVKLREYIVCSPVTVDHSRTVLSSELDTTVLPSAEIATAMT